jgi:PAS domain S-box-containing protein
MTPAINTAFGWRVLIIDDSAEDRSEARRLLLRGSDRRYIFAEAETGVAGMAAVLAAAEPPDCVVLDYNLPDMDAPEVLAGLAGPDGLPVCPVVVLTGGAGPESGRLVLRAGAQDYIGKDWLTPPGLTRAVENAIERLSVARDMLARDAALRRSQRELQTLADNTPDVLSRFDRDLRFVFVNAAVEKVMGRKPREFLGKTLGELAFPSELCILVDESLRWVFSEGVPRSVEFSHEGSAGLRHFATQLVPEFGQEELVEYVLSVTHDVTDRMVYQKVLAESDRRKDEFIATLAHELRNPLAPMLTGLQVLRLTLNAQRAHPTLEMMDRQLGQMARLVDDLLDVSRITNGKVLLRRERVLVSTVVEAAVETVWPIVEGRHHTFVVEVPPEPLWLDADPTRLAQVIGNVLNNAAKYSHDGGHITLAVCCQEDEAVIRVTDNGLGIPQNMLSAVFDMFTQVRETPERTQGGLGIGLALVKRLVEMHNGSVFAESAGADKGSTFTMRLPIAAAPAQTAPSDAPANSEAPLQLRRVLVVDDNVDGAETLAEMLAFSGHDTRSAFSGSEALDSAAGFDPEVLFVDIGLPDMTGYEVARRLRADPRHANVLLVAVTGWGSEEDRRRSKDAGFDAHLTKPVEPAVFDDLLARFPALQEERIQAALLLAP